MLVTDHAERRFAQRGIKVSDIEMVMRLGCKIHRTGVTFYTLRRKDIPDEFRRRDRLSKLEGATLLVRPADGVIITAYKNRRSFRQIKKKGKWASLNPLLRGIH